MGGRGEILCGGMELGDYAGEWDSQESKGFPGEIGWGKKEVVIFSLLSRNPWGFFEKGNPFFGVVFGRGFLFFRVF